MEGYEKLKQRLLEEAQQRALEIREDARRQVERKKNELEAHGSALRAEQAQQLEKRWALQQKRAEATASLEVRKLILSEKQKLVEETLASVESELEQLPESWRRQYYAKLLQQRPDLDLIVYYDRMDEALLHGLVAELGYQAELRLNVGQGLGLIFQNGPVREDCTFRTLLRTREEEWRSLLAEQLFVREEIGQ